MSDEGKRKRGLEKFEEVMRFSPPDLQGEAFLDSTIEHLFAEVWAAPGLSVRDRRLVTLTILVMVGNEMTLRLHFGAAMQSGDLGDEEIDAFIVHLAHYAGWPKAAIASQVVRQLRSER
jgi:4-carboxymuconolactone decarboxylase